MVQVREEISFQYIPNDATLEDDLVLLGDLEKIAQKRGSELKVVRMPRAISDYTAMPRIITEEGHVVSGREGIKKYLNKHLENKEN